MPEAVGKFEISWWDRERNPECPSDPAYPDGIDLDCSDGAAVTCTAKLPYPARRCGGYVVKCLLCGTTAGATTAGRRDDPRSIVVPCKAMARA